MFDDVPGLGDATRRGELSGDYADAINQASGRLTQAERDAFIVRYRETLTTKALAMGLHEFRVHVRGLVEDFGRASELERFQQQRRQRCGRIWDDAGDGMTKLFAAFDPETGATIRKAIDEEVDRIYRAKRDDPDDTRSHQQVVGDAIANLILGARAAGTPRTELVVLVDLHTLVTGDRDDSDEGDTTHSTVAAAGSEPADTGDTADGDAAAESTGRCCETSDGAPRPIEVVRRIACGAGIIPAVLNGDGVVLDLGRSQRLASSAQRLALRVMYPTCAFDGCTIGFDRCEIHHTDPFAPPTNGNTNIDKLVPTCQRHHHHIHDHHLQLSLDPDSRTMTVTHPDGSEELHPLPTRRRRPSPTSDVPSHVPRTA